MNWSRFYSLKFFSNGDFFVTALKLEKDEKSGFKMSQLSSFNEKELSRAVNLVLSKKEDDASMAKVEQGFKDLG